MGKNIKMEDEYSDYALFEERPNLNIYITSAIILIVFIIIWAFITKRLP